MSSWASRINMLRLIYRPSLGLRQWLTILVATGYQLRRSRFCRPLLGHSFSGLGFPRLSHHSHPPRPTISVTLNILVPEGPLTLLSLYLLLRSSNCSRSLPQAVTVIRLNCSIPYSSCNCSRPSSRNCLRPTQISLTQPSNGRFLSDILIWSRATISFSTQTSTKKPRAVTAFWRRSDQQVVGVELLLPQLWHWLLQPTITMFHNKSG